MKATVIRVPDQQPGLLMANEQQRTFTLEGAWRSSIAPQVNMTVDLQLDEGGGIRSITVVEPNPLKQVIAEARLAVGRGLADRMTSFISSNMSALLARMQEQHEQVLWWSTYNAVLSGLAARHGVVDSNAYLAATEVANNTHGKRRQPPSSLNTFYRPEWSMDLT